MDILASISTLFSYHLAHMFYACQSRISSFDSRSVCQPMAY